MQYFSVERDVGSGPPNYWRQNSFIIVFLLVGIMAIGRFAYAVDFDVTVNLSWSEYQVSSQTLSVTADGKTWGKCHHDEYRDGAINIPFAQTVILNQSVNGECDGKYTRYREEGKGWMEFNGTRVLHNYQGQLQFNIYARNHRSSSLRNLLKCYDCTVGITTSFSGGTPTPKQSTNSYSYSIEPSQITPLEVDRITLPISGDVIPQGATCEAISGHDDVEVLCEQQGEGFVIYANIDNEAPTVSDPSPANPTELEERADITLNWIGNDLENDDLTYDVFFGGELICENITTTTCVVPADKLEFGTEYMWYVEAKDKYQTSTKEIWNFSIRDNLPPEPFTYIAPVNALDNVKTGEDIIFEWNASSDKDGEEITYQLCRQKIGGEIVCNPKQSETSKTLPPDTLEYGTAYEWFVVARDTYGNTTIGNDEIYWSLTTIQAPVNLLMTADAGRSNSRLEWSITNDAAVAHYRILRVPEGGDFTPDTEITTVDTPADFFLDEDALDAGSKYCYRIDALDADKTPLHQSNSTCVTAGMTTLAMKDVGGLQGTEVDVPIMLPNAGGLQIGSSDIWLGYDPNVIEVPVDENNNCKAKEEGSLIDGKNYSVGCKVDPQSDDFHIVKISISDNDFTAPPLEGEGALIYVTFNVIGEALSSSPLKLIPFDGFNGSTMQDYDFIDIPIEFEDRSFTVQTRKRGTRDGNRIPKLRVGAEYSRGDLNGNGTPQTVDARMAQFIGVGKLEPTSKQRIAGDVNEDGTVDSADAYKITYFVLNSEWPGTSSTNTRRRSVRDGNSATNLSLEEVSGESGSIVTTTLSINNLPKLSAMNLAIVYDTQVIEKITKVSKTGLAAGTDLVFHDDGNGILRIGISTQQAISGNGDLATLELQLATGGNVKTSPLSIAQAHLYNSAGHDFGITLQRTITASHGKVTLIDIEPSETPKDDGVVTTMEELIGSTSEPTEPVGPVYTASGTIIDKDNNPISGIVVQIKDKNAVTNKEGQWEISDLISNHYLLEATGENYEFKPQVIAVRDTDVVVEIEGSPITVPVYTASGQLLDDFGKPIFNATVEINSNEMNKVVTTDENGIWKVSLPNDTYTLTAFKVDNEGLHQFVSKKFTIVDGDSEIEVNNDGPHHADGTITNDSGNPIAGVTIQVSNDETVREITTNSQGYWRVDGLFENISKNYQVTANKNGYVFGTKECGVGPGQFCKLVFEPESVLDVRVYSDPEQLKEGDEITYTIKVVNNGDATATGVNLAIVMLEGANFVSINPVDGGSCNSETMTCSLPNLKFTEYAAIEVVMASIDANKIVNRITVKSNEYPDNVKLSLKKVKPNFSVSIKGTPNPVIMGDTIHYTANVELNQYAPTPATGIKLVMKLPTGVRLESVNTEHGSCNSSPATVTCSLTNLSINNPDDISQATVNMNVKIIDAGLLVAILEGKVTANEYPAHIYRKRSQIFVPPEYQVGMAIVVDVTGSMQEEINGIKKALKKFMEEIGADQFPLSALVVFRDEVTVKAITSNMDELMKSIDKIEVNFGGSCAEASIEALDKAISHVKEGGTIFFVTDASPYSDADVIGMVERLNAKNIKLNPVVTGDCTNRDNWNLPE